MVMEKQSPNSPPQSRVVGLKPLCSGKSRHDAPAKTAANRVKKQLESSFSARVSAFTSFRLWRVLWPEFPRKSYPQNGGGSTNRMIVNIISGVVMITSFLYDLSYKIFLGSILLHNHRVFAWAYGIAPDKLLYMFDPFFSGQGERNSCHK